MPENTFRINTVNGTLYQPIWGTIYADQIMTFGRAEVKVSPPPKLQHLKNTGTSNCCGANFLEFFPQPDGYGNIRKEIVDDVEQEIEDKKQFFNSMQLVILNHKQKKHYHKMLLDNGFQELYTCNHPGHGNDLTLYAWQRHKPKHEINL